MEKTNWIEKTREAIRVAMNKGKCIIYYNDKDLDIIGFNIEINNNNNISIDYFKQRINIRTQNGYAYVDYNLTDRDKLELQALILSVKEYREDMAISEFNEFISNKENKPKDIDDLDNDEE